MGEEQRPHRPQVGGGDAHRDQRVHRGGAVAQIRPRGAMERPSAPDHDGRRKREDEPLPILELERGHHRQQRHRHTERRRHQQPLTPRCRLVRFGGLGLPEARCRQRRGVARRLHGRDQFLRAHAIGKLNLRLFGREVDAGGDPVDPVELLLDPGRARCGHPADRESD